MTREIKFRFWNKDEKKFEYDCLDSRSTYQNPFTRGDLVPLQFTGLKDKNGKEIYEGDWIKGKGEVVCGNQFGQTTVRKTFKRGKTKEYLFHEVLDKNAEVIGNIYENPELQS